MPAAAAAVAEVVEGAVAEAGGGEGGALRVRCVGRLLVKGDHEGDAEMCEEVGVEGGAEVAMVSLVGKVSCSRSMHNVVVWCREEQDLAGDEGVDLAIELPGSSKMVSRPKFDFAQHGSILQTWNNG